MPKIGQVRKYLRRKANGWVLVRDTDHEYYEKTLPDGRLLQTMLSHGSGEVPPPVWHKMLKQMGITQEEFNAGI